jgi:ATP-dependent RNA helicase RhlE
MSRTSREVRPGACRGHADAHSKAHSLTSFHDFGLNEAITRALAQENYATPPPIQAQTIPIILSGRDLIGIAQTGTGKCNGMERPGKRIMR